MQSGNIQKSDPLARSMISKRGPPADVRASTSPLQKKFKPEPSASTKPASRVSIEDAEELPRRTQASETYAEEPEEEEDPRFFSGGLTEEQSKALDYLDAKDSEDFGPAMALDSNGFRKLVTRFQKAVDKNQSMRARYSDEPMKFLDSEVELNQETKGLAVLSEYPNLFREFVSTGCLGLLISLFGHENSDIANSAVQVLDEITEEDAAVEEEDFEALKQGLQETLALETLVQNLSRLDESVLEERDAIFKSMSILENIINLDNSFVQILHNGTSICAWLLARLKQPDEIGFPMSENRQYAAELLSIFCQNSSDIVTSLIDKESIDTILMLVAPFRKRDPEKGSTEEEFVENLFDILDILVTQSQGKDRFIEGEGVELMQRLMMDARSAETRLRALRTLEYACGSWLGGAVCHQVVEAGLLGNLFSVFMKKDEPELVRACLGIFVSFFRTLNDGEAERFRVINKFLEKQHSKIARLLAIRQDYATKHDAYRTKQLNFRAARSSRLDKEDQVEYQLTEYLDRMENGLDVLQLVDIILAWLMASDDSAAAFITASGSQHFGSMISVLQELVDSLPKDDEGTKTSEAATEVQQEREMLEAILQAIPVG